MVRLYAMVRWFSKTNAENKITNALKPTEIKLLVAFT